MTDDPTPPTEPEAAAEPPEAEASPKAPEPPKSPYNAEWAADTTARVLRRRNRLSEQDARHQAKVIKAFVDELYANPVTLLTTEDIHQMAVMLLGSMNGKGVIAFNGDNHFRLGDA